MFIELPFHASSAVNLPRDVGPGGDGPLTVTVRLLPRGKGPSMRTGSSARRPVGSARVPARDEQVDTFTVSAGAR